MQSRSSKPVVLHLIRCFEILKRGSLEEFLITLSDRASSQYELVFVLGTEPPAWLRQEVTARGARIDTAYLKTSWQGFRDLDRLMRTYKPQIVHVHFFSLLSPFIPYLRWRYGKTIVVHIHSVIPYETGNSRVSTWLIPLRKRVGVKSVAKYIATSNFVRRKTLDDFPVRQEQITTIYNGVITDRRAQPGRDNIRFSLGLSENAVIIFSAAWLKEMKGMHIFIQALSKVLERASDNIVGIVAGDGPQLPELQMLVESLGIESNIYFLGWRNDLPQLIEESDIVVVPSVCPEACSYFLLESMAGGKPIVGSAIGGIPELLSGQPRAGLLFQPGDAEGLSEALLQLILNPQKQRELSAEGRRRGEKRFHIFHQIDLIMDTYAKLSV